MSNPNATPNKTHPAPPIWLVTPILLLAVIAAAVAIWRNDPAGLRGKLPGSFRYDMADATPSPELIRWTEMTDGQFPLRLDSIAQTLPSGEKQIGQPTGLAAQRNAAGQTLVAVVFDIGMIRLDRVSPSHTVPVVGGFGGRTGRLDGTPTCIAACPWRFPDGEKTEEPTESENTAGDVKSLGRWLIGYGNRVVVYRDGKETPLATLDAGSHATSIAVEDADGDGIVEEILVADWRKRCVWRLDGRGKELGRIGVYSDSMSTSKIRSPAPSRPTEFLGFAIPSPYFAVAVSPDGLIRVANPGYRRVEGFTTDGYRETVFGETGERTDAFCGCCNPTRLAIFPDGRIVTAEKGITRVKIYSPDGKLTEVVAPPAAFDPKTPPIDIAVLPGADEPSSTPPAGSAADRVFVLDPQRMQLRAFKRIAGDE